MRLLLIKNPCKFGFWEGMGGRAFMNKFKRILVSFEINFEYYTIKEILTNYYRNLCPKNDKNKT